ncbi:hypothetical protein [Pseudonocardia lacus]|uniref:hypothetical protein n=1 Tax=Pseudonocardia lacus TaxID=2835865 RepID=UPI001BDCA80B|nr:hypothetical protein [Pseudonocardia lacus]
MSTPDTDRSGSTRVTAPPRRPLWLWVLLAVVVIALLVWALVQCGTGSDDPGDGQGTAGGAVPSATPAGPGTDPSGGDAAGSADAPQTGAPAAGAPTDGAAGSLSAGGTALLPLSASAGPDGALTALVGQDVTAQGVVVQSVPSDEGFWVGGSETDRVWVQLTVPAGESPYTVQPGQRLDFTGPLTAHGADFAQRVGVDAAEGADQLTREAAHVEVAKADLRVQG